MDTSNFFSEAELQRLLFVLQLFPVIIPTIF
jgi:hypothetical protein